MLLQLSYFLLLTLALGGRASAEDKPAHVILISLDTVTANHLKAYGYGYETTPFLDGFAKESILFENAFSQAAYTLPSHFSIFTGVVPQTHQMQTDRLEGRTARTLSTKIPTLAELLKGAGYATYWSEGLAFKQLDLEAGLARGFDHFHANLMDHTVLPAAKELRYLLATGTELRYLLRSAKTQPSFLFFHTYLAHDPYQPERQLEEKFGGGKKKLKYRTREDFLRLVEGMKVPDEDKFVSARQIWKRQFNTAKKRDLQELSALYDAGLHNLDGRLEQFFKILKEEGMYENSVIIVTSDHGESFGENGEYCHQTPYRAQLKVPLYIRLPGQTPRRIATPVYGIDIAPTILELAGLKGSPVAEGQSLVPLIRRGEPPARGSYGFALGFQSEAVYDEKWKLLVRDSRPAELYQIDQDPREERNVAKEFPQEALRLETALRAFKASRISFRGSAAQSQRKD